MQLSALVDWIHRYKDEVVARKDELTDLDRQIGDADHGFNMARGMQAASDKIDAAVPATVGELGKSVGMTLVSTVGGASGPLYGTFFLRFGTAAGGVTELDAAGLAAAFRSAVDGIVGRGKAELGDKTMLDALIPATEALEAAAAAGEPAELALDAAAEAAENGSQATFDLVARKGRASYLGERSAGHLDPGSVSSAILVRTLADAAKG